MTEASIRRGAHRELAAAARAAGEIEAAARGFRESVGRLVELLFPDQARHDGPPDRALASLDELGEWIRDARTGLGLSQAQLGGLARVSVAAVSLYENGRSRPSVATWERLVRALEGGG